MPTALVILAAGKGTRMQSDLPKVLHPLGSAPLLAHAMTSGASLAPEMTVVVGGHGFDRVKDAVAKIDPDAIVVMQEKQLGTGHAVDQARSALKDFIGNVVVLYGDTPFVSAKTLENMLETREQGPDVVILGFEAPEPGQYGRLICDASGQLEAIVEAKDATDEQLAIKLCNSGVVAADAALLFDLIEKLENNNASEEYYLTDIVALANASGHKCAAVTCPMEETFGINSRAELALAEASFQSSRRLEALENGVGMVDPGSVFFAHDTEIGKDITIGPNVFFGPGVTVESGAVINAFCHLEGCHISQKATIGPFARLRTGAEIGDGARVGNFVEIKASEVGEGAKINHLSYVGDAEVGNGANIGAGTITCNYDGVMKHQTSIGKGAFIGSNTSLVAPVTIGNDAMTASGSVINKDVPDGALGIARARQTIMDGFATRFFKRLRAIKSRQVN